MAAVLRLFTILLVLIGLSATGVAGPEAQAAPNAEAAQSSMPSPHDCAQLMAAAADRSETETPSCPGAPMMAAGACGGPLAMPVDSSVEFQRVSALEPIGSSARQAWDLLLVTPFFRPPIV